MRKETKSASALGPILLFLMSATLFCLAGFEKTRGVAAKIQSPPLVLTSSPTASVREAIAIWKLHDQYDFLNGKIRMKSQAPREVEINYELPSIPGVYQVQFSQDVMFGQQVQALTAGPEGFRLTKAGVGENYYRFSDGRGGWLPARSFRVTLAHLPFQPDQLRAAEAIIMNERTHVPLTWTFTKDFRWTLLHVSDKPEFKKFRVYWVEGNSVTLPVEKLGAFYVRLQAVSNNQELSRFSKAFRIDVKVPGRVPQQDLTPHNRFAFSH